MRRLETKWKPFEVSLAWKNPDGIEDYRENVDVEEDEIKYNVFQENKWNKINRLRYKK